MMKRYISRGASTWRRLSVPAALVTASLAFSPLVNAQVVFSEDFTGGASTTGFTVDQNVGTCTWTYDNPGSRAITGAGFDADFAIFDGDFCGSAAGASDADLVSAPFDASTGNFLLSFDQQYRSCCGSIATVDVWDGAMWNNVYSLSTVSVGYPNPAGSQSINITAAAGGSATAQVRFHYEGDYAWWWALDNIAVEAVNCLYPSDLAVSGITIDGGSISWTDNGSTGYEWAITAGPAPDGTNEVASGDGSNLDITGLSSGTPYTAYVRSNCSGDFSPWSAGVSFTTGISNDECDGAVALTVNPNYNCGSTTPGTVSGATGSGITSTCSGTADDDVWFSFTATDTLHRISLENFTGSTSDMYMALWTGDCGTLTLVPGSCSDPESMDIGGLTPGTTYYLQVYTWTSTAGQTSAFDVCVGSEPFCQPPLAITLESISAPDATVSWTDNGAMSYQYELRVSGDVGSGATGLVDGGMVASSPLSLTGLVADSLYTLYVRSICSEGDTSAWSAGLVVLDGYCMSNFSNVTYEFVTNVTFAGINNTSVGNIGGPVDYTDQVAQVEQGGTDTLSITITADASDYVYAFIDWNQNNTLDDAGEVYVLASGTDQDGPHTLAITIPMDAAIGQTRMRAMVDWNHDTPDPCRVATYGEAEDYTVEVSGGGTPMYCDSLSYQFDVEPICNVTFAGIDNTSSGEINGVDVPMLEDFTATPPAMVIQGESYPISVTGTTGGDYIDYITAFFDWNQDGTFETTVELGFVENDTCAVPLLSTIAVPLDAMIGDTRMRLVKNYNSSPLDPCGVYSYGQGEDYTVHVDLSIGIPETIATGLGLAPNPAHDRIALINPNGTATQALVYDMVGNLVMKTSNVDAINIGTLTTGSYVLVAQDAAGTNLAHLRFVKQ